MTKGSDKWEAYEEAPGGLRPLLRARWVVAYPLQITLGYGWTVGEVILAVCLLALVVVAGVGWKTGSSGELATLPLIATFATAARNSPITFLLGIPFDRRVSIHKMCAVLSYLGAIMHGLIAFVSGEATGHTKYLWSGLAALSCALLLYVTSLPYIRRNAFDFFYFLHWPLFISYAALLVIHGATSVLIGVALWFVDVVIRVVYMAAFQPHQGTIRHVEGTNIVEVSVDGLKYSSGQYAFIAVKSVGIFQWHPISISSAPCEGSAATFLIRCGGDWGESLIALAQNQSERETQTILIDGPYGNHSIDIDSDRYKHFLFIAGGIGITPLRSTATAIIDQSKRGRTIGILETHWSVRDGVAAAVPMTQSHGLTMYSTAKADYTEMHTQRALSTVGDIHIGRMDVKKVVKKFKKRVVASHLKDSEVAVLFCGPAAMLEPLRKACKKYSSSAVSFSVHSETFDF